ncbi:hypothetical protein OUZ56_020468 [Daphnia magna]|uniref:Uncharacterized protein n=1 Tax=Daphnia magna TaxID=35525 RepID=A0ABQ9ZEJ5_9CRUS|nr:hypothetical protein OUZ56_020468 [Daphnia magna]
MSFINQTPVNIYQIVCITIRVTIQWSIGIIPSKSNVLKAPKMWKRQLNSDGRYWSATANWNQLSGSSRPSSTTKRKKCSLKTNMEAAEERGDELQRLLDASRAAESQSRCQLRLLQQQRQQQQLLLMEEQDDDDAEELPSTAIASASVHQQNPFHSLQCSTMTNNSRKVQMEDTMTVCRLVDDLAEVEERLHLMETDWMEEKRKRMQLEAEVIGLQQENQRLHQQQSVMASSGHLSSSASIGCDPASLAPVSLSLSEELLISSSTDFSSAQWRDAWDNSGSVSLVGSGMIRKLCSEDEELCSDSSSSGFSEDNQRSSVAKATQTDPLMIDLPAKTIATTTSSADWADIRSLFREIFAVIQQNL